MCVLCEDVNNKDYNVYVHVFLRETMNAGIILKNVSV